MMHWSSQDWTVFFGALVTVIGAIATATVKILERVREIHLSINSRMDELVAETRKAALSEGRDQMRMGIEPPVMVVKPPGGSG